MNALVFTLLTLLCRLGAWVSFLWVIVEFILFVFKDDKFNTDSIVCLVCAWVGVFIFGFLGIASAQETKNNRNF